MIGLKENTLFYVQLLSSPWHRVPVLVAGRRYKVVPVKIAVKLE